MLPSSRTTLFQTSTSERWRVFVKQQLRVSLHCHKTCTRLGFQFWAQRSAALLIGALATTLLRAAAARRQQALEARRLSPDSPACLQELQDARHASRRLVRDLKARWWSGRLQRLEAAARRNDAAAAFSDAKEMGRLLRSQGVVVEPLAVSPDADLMAKAAHFQAVLNVQRPVSDDVWNDIPDLSLIFRGILLRSMSYGTPSSSCPMANLLTRQASTRSS